MEGRMDLEYTDTLYSPLTQHLVSRLTSFCSSLSFTNMNWSWAVLLKVTTEPRNLKGSSSSDLSWINSLVSLLVKKKGMFVALPPQMESVLHLDGLKNNPMDSALIWTSFWSFLCLILLFVNISKSSAKGLVITLVFPNEYPWLSLCFTMKSRSGWKTTLKIMGL